MVPAYRVRAVAQVDGVSSSRMLFEDRPTSELVQCVFVSRIVPSVFNLRWCDCRLWSSPKIILCCQQPSCVLARLWNERVSRRDNGIEE